jgi:hypothetical protein
MGKGLVEIQTAGTPQIVRAWIRITTISISTSSSLLETKSNQPDPLRQTTDGISAEERESEERCLRYQMLAASKFGEGSN